MARHFTVYTEDLSLRELKRRLEKHAKFQLIAHKDCKRLSELLVHKGIHISPMTLARCFGITSSAHRPFLSTLDLLSIYLGYNSFSHFSSDLKETTRFSLSRPEMQFSMGEYSYSALELAIRVNDWNTVRQLIDSYQGSYPESMEFVWFLGQQVRNHSDKYSFLTLLADTENGRKYFFESFVDEDDPNEYYSQALHSFYNSKIKSIGEKLFFHSFLDSKRIYKNGSLAFKNVGIYDEAIDSIRALHHHQISRLFEMRILKEHAGLNRLSEMGKIIDELLPHIRYSNQQVLNWVLMRSVRALVFSGHFRAIIQGHAALKNQIEKQFKNSEGLMLSSADLALQYIVFGSPEFKHLIESEPCRLRGKNFHDENSRMVLESATSSLVAPPEISALIKKNLVDFVSKTEHKWILQLFRD